MADSDFGQSLLAALRRQRLSLRGLGRATEIDPATLSRLKSGKQRPTLSHLERIATAVDVPLATLLRWAGYGARRCETAPRRWEDVLEDSLDGHQKEELEHALRQYETLASTEEGLALISSRTLAKLDECGAGGTFRRQVHDLFQAALDVDRPHAERAKAGSALLLFIVEADIIPDDQFPVGYLDDAVAVDRVWKKICAPADKSREGMRQTR